MGSNESVTKNLLLNGVSRPVFVMLVSSFPTYPIYIWDVYVNAATCSRFCSAFYIAKISVGWLEKQYI